MLNEQQQHLSEKFKRRQFQRNEGFLGAHVRTTENFFLQNNAAACKCANGFCLCQEKLKNFMKFPKTEAFMEKNGDFQHPPFRSQDFAE